jgi:hypothetical protein
MDSVEKYVMIAELNTVVPTFDVSADAPTQIPLVPHFDTQSTDVYYKLHWQPTWGFRVKENVPSSSHLDNTLPSTIDSANYPSDETAKHYIYTFNPATGINEKQEEKEYNAAIFFNKEGFDADVHTYYSQEENAENINKAGEAIHGSYKDIIAVVPTG